MGQTKGIPERLLPNIHAMFAAGKSTRHVGDWLKKQHRITVVSETINACRRAWKEENLSRSSATLSAGGDDDAAHLSRRIEEAKAVIEVLHEQMLDGDTGIATQYVRMLELERRLVATRMKFAAVPDAADVFTGIADFIAAAKRREADEGET